MLSVCPVKSSTIDTNVLNQAQEHSVCKNTYNDRASWILCRNDSSISPVMISHGNFLQYDRAKRPQAFK